MMKKLLSIALILVLALSVCMFGGCGDKFSGNYTEVTDAKAKQNVAQKFNAASTETLAKGAKAAFSLDFSQSAKIGDNEKKSTLSTSGNVKFTNDKLSTDFKFDMNMYGNKASCNAKAYGEINSETLLTALYVNGKSSVETNGTKQDTTIKSKYTIDLEDILGNVGFGGMDMMAQSSASAGIDVDALFSTAKIYTDEAKDGSCKIKLDITAAIEAYLEKDDSTVSGANAKVYEASIYVLLDADGKITGVKVDIDATTSMSILTSSYNTSIKANLTVFAGDITIATPTDLDTYTVAQLPMIG